MQLAVFTKNRSNPAYTAARLGADRVAHAMGAQVTHYVPDTPDNALEQLALIDEALKAKPDAAVVSPVHLSAVDSGLRRLHDAGIPLIALVTPILAVPAISFVHSDDYALGDAIARRLFETLNGHGTVLVVGGHTHSPTSKDRLRGFESAVKDFPGITLTAPVVGDYIFDTARDRTRRWLREEGRDVSLDGCLVANDIMALGVIEALRAEHKPVPAVVGVNAIPDAITAIRQGQMLATADFNAMNMAAIATECAIRHLRGDGVPRHMELPVEIVDQRNAVRWDQPYEDRSLWSLDGAREEILRTGTGRLE